MTDKELLEAAARAAGYSIHTWLGDIYHTDFGRGVIWNPLKEDGDAFRLMADLGITIEYYDGFEEVWATHNNTWITIEQPYGDNRVEATRIAIVKAAAAERIEE